MPTYDYICPDCGAFEARASMADFQKPQSCPHCTTESPRALLTVPAFAMMDGTRRHAMATNERSSHEPTRSSKVAHGAGCSCCSGKSEKKSSGTLYRPDGSKSFPAKRPWMISH